MNDEIFEEKEYLTATEKRVAMREFSNSLDSFTRLMFLKFLKNNEEKGIPTLEKAFYMDKKYLIGKMNEHFQAGNFIDCANYCFLLYLKYGDKT